MMHEITKIINNILLLISFKLSRNKIMHASAKKITATLVREFNSGQKKYGYDIKKIDAKKA
jgi:hypothetical protein